MEAHLNLNEIGCQSGVEKLFGQCQKRVHYNVNGMTAVEFGQWMIWIWII